MFTRLLLTSLSLVWMLFETNGGDAGGSGGDPPPAAKPDAKKTDAGGEPAPKPEAGAGDGGSGEQTIPYSRFKEVNDELQRRRTEEQARADAEATKKGEFEKVIARKDGENASLRETLSAVALRNAFYNEANGKASNLRLAYIAALEGEHLGELKVEIDLEKKSASVSGDVKKIVEAVLKENPELKAKATSFGDDRGGTSPSDPGDVSKLDPVQKIELGYRETKRATGSRSG